jgi:hypothetical protein
MNNQEALSTNVNRANNKAALRKQKDNERILVDMKQRKSDEIWQELPPDGYFILECQCTDLAKFDAALEKVLIYELNVPSSQALDDVENRFDYIQPPSWLSAYVPHSSGIFVIDEVLLLTRNSSDNRNVLAFIEDDATSVLLMNMYKTSRLYMLSAEEGRRHLLTENLGLQPCVRELLERVWEEAIPNAYKQLFSYFLDPFILSYCIGGARMLDMLDDDGLVIEALQLALLYCLCLKTCMKMRNVKRWRSSLYTSNARDTSQVMTRDDVGTGESDIADLDREIRGDMTENDVEEDRKIPLVLNFTNKAEEARMVDTEDDRRTRVNGELDQRRADRLHAMRALGAKINYLESFSLQSSL